MQLKIEKAAREAERKTRDAQNELESARLDTELEVLTLKREAEAAVAEAQVLEDVAEMHAILENGKVESEERFRLQRTSEYVHSQIDQNQPTSPPIPVPPVKSSVHAESQDSFRTWHPPANTTEFQTANHKPKPEGDNEAHLPAPNLSRLTRVESKTDINRTHTRSASHTTTHASILSITSSQPSGTVFSKTRSRDIRIVPV